LSLTTTHCHALTLITSEFGEKAAEISRTLDMFAAACAELQASASLKALLAMALELGNMANSKFAPAR
jgi:hypothetical protein